MRFYLEKINKVYYFRLRVPKDLVPFLEVNQLRKSLKTKSHADAKTLARGFLNGIEKLFVTIRSGMLTQEQITEAVASWKAMYLRNMVTAKRKGGQDTFLPVELKEQKLKRDLPLSTAERTEKIINEFQRKRQEYNECILTNSFEGTRRFAKVLLQKISMDVEPTDDELELACEALLMARIDICDIMIERFKGNYNNPFDSQAVKSPLPLPVQPALRMPARKLSELWDEFYQDKISRNKWKPRTSEKNKDEFRAAVAILGNRPLSEYGNADVINLIESMRNRGAKKASLSVKSINFRVQLLSSLFRFALDDDPEKWGVKRNPFAKKQVEDKREESEERDEFSREELEGMLRVLSNVRQVVDPDKYWVPLICLYSGMRAGEACQLRTDDIEKIGDVWIFNICNYSEFNQSTKNGKNRTCPVHPTLIKLGFLKYVEQRRFDKKSGQLFNKLKWNNRNWHKRVTVCEVLWKPRKQ